MIRVFLCLLLVSALNTQCQNPSSQAADPAIDTAPMTVFLVRHAEKEAGDDPALTAEGMARAEALAALLDRVPVDAIFSTDYRRTQLTAAPTAKAKNLEVLSYDPRALPAFAEQLKANYAGKTILVVGHSNTTPTLTGLIDGTEAHDPFDESDYQNLMVVSVPAAGPTKTFRLRF